MNLIKSKKFFCDKIINNSSIKFPKISKDISALKRLDKISIFEYFNIIEERKESKPNEYLIKEIVDFIYSSTFDKEFKYTLADEEKKFKFLLLNIGLLANRIENCAISRENFNFLNYLGLKIVKAKLSFCFKFLPLKYYCNEVLKFYIGKNQIANNYKKNFILENEFLKKFNKKDFTFTKIKRQFIEDLNLIDSDEEGEKNFTDKFIEKYIKNFILNYKNSKNEKRINENEVEKLFLYFIAHVRYYLSNI